MYYIQYYKNGQWHLYSIEKYYEHAYFVLGECLDNRNCDARIRKTV